MGKVYIDADKHYHADNLDGSYQEVETEFFFGKCDTFIEGYCYDDSKGYIRIYPWKPYDQLAAVQYEYERQKLAEYNQVLQELGVEV